MIKHPTLVYENAVRFRKKGYSYAEISDKLKIAKSTASLWLGDVRLTETAKKRIERRKQIGQINSLKYKAEKKKQLHAIFEKKAMKIISTTKFDINIHKIMSAIFFATEGGKFTNSHVVFINSDPRTIATFTKLLGLAFNIDQSKFRALVHIHEYHNDNLIKNFWSKVTSIPLTQFYKSYQKPHTKKRIRENYKGTISIRYYDYKVALELRWIYNILTSKFGGVV